MNYTEADIITLYSITQPEVTLIIQDRKLLDNGNVEIITATYENIYTQAEKRLIQQYINLEYNDHSEFIDTITSEMTIVDVAYSFWKQLSDITQDRLNDDGYNCCVYDTRFLNLNIPAYKFEAPRYIEYQHNSARTVDILNIDKCSYIVVNIEYSVIYMKRCNISGEYKILLPSFDDVKVVPVLTQYDSISDTEDEISTVYSKKIYVGFAD